MPLLEVQPLVPWTGTVGAWRGYLGPSWVEQGSGVISLSPRARGRRVRMRHAWSGEEAADLSGVPGRTVRDWVKRGLVEPTVVGKQVGVGGPEQKPRWGGADVLALVVVDDLRRAGLPDEVRQRVSATVQSVFGFADFEIAGERHLPGPLVDVLAVGERWFVPTTTAGAKSLGEAQPEIVNGAPDAIVFFDPGDACERDPRTGESLHVLLCRCPEVDLVEYPIARRVTELSARFAAFWDALGYPLDRRPPWLS